MDNRNISGMLESSNNFLSPGQGHFAKGLDFRNENRKSDLAGGDFNFEGRQDLGISRQQNKEMTITTQEGDVVTIEDASFLEGSVSSYNSFGKQGGQLSFFSYKSESFSSGREFSLSVDGDLSRSEIKDINNILKEMEGIMADMKNGDLSKATESAMNLLGDKDSLQGLDASLSFEEILYMKEESLAVISAPANTPANATAKKDDVSNEIESARRSDPRKMILDFIEKIRERMEELKKKSDVKPEKIRSVMEQLVEKLSDHKPEEKVFGLMKKIMGGRDTHRSSDAEA